MAASITRSRSYKEAEAALIEWAASDSMRDRLVLKALAAGITKNQVHIITGIARSTINRIIESGRRK